MEPLHQFTESRYRSLRVWYDFIDATRTRVDSLVFGELPSDSDRSAVFLAFWPDPYAEYSIRNVMHFAGPGWGLQVFTTRRTRQFVDRIAARLPGSRVITVNLESTVGTPDAADILKRSPDFWRLLRGQHLLLFDSHTLFLRQGLQSYLEFDYVAPVWHDDEMPEPASLVGVGALSLRHRSSMIEVASSNVPDPALYHREDHFFVHHLHRNPDRYRLASSDVARQFASQNDFGDAPLALRKAWIGNSPENLERLLGQVRY